MSDRIVGLIALPWLGVVWVTHWLSERAVATLAMLGAAVAVLATTAAVCWSAGVLGRALHWAVVQWGWM